MSAVIQPASFSQVFVNPTQTVAGQKQLQPLPVSTAPASQLPASLKRKQAQIALQGHEDEQDDSSASTPQPTPRTRGGRDGAKKKKASRACVHCQKAHLTCDDTRPCQRCVKRGLADTCTEGHRKKAKYLLDEEEFDKLKPRSDKSTVVVESPIVPSPTISAPPSTHPQPPFDPADPVFSQTVPFDATFSFGSEAANLEYSILSAILGNPSPPDTTSPAPAAPGYTAWAADDPIEFGTTRPPTDFGATFTDPSITLPAPEATLEPSSSSFLNYQYPQPSDSDPSQFPSQFGQDLHPLQPRFPLDGRPPSPTFSSKDAAISPAATNGSQLQSINDRVTKPYDYTEGYHFLMKHLPACFEKNDILRIVRALAIFRPSLIALQMPLSFDDEVFAEKCFQRSLLELDKLMSFSGTPTVVWRRTGEICLVAPEFCMLTDWSMDELVGKKKFIYELFENQSVVEYWENFASHAFENTTKAVFSHCVLLKPSGAPVPATFCFSIRRDLFDLPSIVIGQWLPLL